MRYNHFHDQLVLTSSSDSRVILNNVVTLSSEPYGHLVEKDDDSDSDSQQDRCVPRSESGVDVVLSSHLVPSLSLQYENAVLGVICHQTS